MNGWLRAGVLTLVVTALAALPFPQMSLQAQEASARFRVMVPRLLPGPDTGDNFGEDVAEDLRDLINDMSTHQPVDEDEIEDAMDRFDLDWEDLNCTRTRQLGQQIQAELVFCGGYVRDGESFHVGGSFVTSEGEVFPVDSITVSRDDQEEATAQHFFEALNLMVDQLRYATFCQDYAQSQQWENALTNCNRAIELNPATVGSRFTRARVLREMERYEEALAGFQQVLEMDPIHEAAMQNAGYLAAQLGDDEQAREYYSNYLELNPANAQVRMRVAYELAEAGDPLGAMQLVEEGLELDPENTNLLKQHGGFAFAAGAEANRECQAEAEAQGQEYDTVCPEAAELYRKALESYGSVFAQEGAELDPGQLRTLVAARITLGEFEEAVTAAEEILETHPEAPQIWSIYADALKRAGRVEEAIEALDRVAEIDQEFAASSNVAARQGQWLLEEGRLEEAVPAFQRAIERGEQSADAVAQFIWADGYQQGIDVQDWDHAIRLMRAAKEFDVSEDMTQQVNFWLGYAIFRRAVNQQEPNTKETAEATLPRFQEALRLLQSSSGYAQRQNLEGTRQELISNTNTYIEIQEAIIRRGR